MGAERGRPRAVVGGQACQGEGVLRAVGVGVEEGELEKSFLVVWVLGQHEAQQTLALHVAPLLQLHARLRREKGVGVRWWA